MAHHLVIVESPAKAVTIKKYLGPDYDVLASYGHVRDLQPKEGAVDPENQFSMTYEVIERNAKHVDAITKSARKADTLYLATDLDREGEAISWHILELLKERKALQGKKVCRVVFHEITPRAIAEAVANLHRFSQRSTGPQSPRLPRWFQSVPVVVEENPPRLVGGSRTESGVTADLRARGGYREIQPARILVG